MRIFAFSDWRIQPLDMLIGLVNCHEPDAVLYAGDDLGRFIPQGDHVILKTASHLVTLTYPGLKVGSRKEGRVLSPRAKRLLPRLELKFSSVLDELKAPFYFVNGNDDFIMTVNKGCYTRLEEGRYTIGTTRYRIAEDADKKIVLMDLWLLLASYRLAGEDEPMPTGSGIYASISPSFGEFKILKDSEELSIIGVECQYGLRNEIVSTPRKYSDIYLSHLPPFGTLDLSSRFGIDHIGSKKLLNAVRKYSPKLVVCGHSHMWGGSVAQMGETIVINVSSHDTRPSTANYALIDTSDWSVEMKAEKPSSIHALPGLRALRNRCTYMRDAKKLRGLFKGSESDLLASLDYVEVRGFNVARIRERIDSLKQKKPKVKRPITFNPYTQTFVDVETGLAQGRTPGKLWLIGIWHNGKIMQFVFPKEKKAFLKYIRSHGIASLASWTRYDADALRSIFEEARIPMIFVDACQRTRNCVTWYTYRLHEFYNAFFQTTPSEDFIEGYVAGLYADHIIIPNIECPYCPTPEKAVEEIKKRNKADILQMVEICMKLWDG